MREFVAQLGHLQATREPYRVPSTGTGAAPESLIFPDPLDRESQHVVMLAAFFSVLLAIGQPEAAHTSRPCGR